jgi:DNA polymerase III sliding clamp (beta) subunit (PCNA family)
MIIKCKELQEVCSKILSAVDTNKLSVLTETLAIYTDKQFLYLAVTNREYYVRVKLDIQDEIEFNATVAADLFLKLISKITTETVEFNITDNYLIIIGNGTYKLPMIYEGSELLKLPKISINNIISSFTIDTSTLYSIMNYNSKELSKKFIATNPAQNLYDIVN